MAGIKASFFLFLLDTETIFIKSPTCVCDKAVFSHVASPRLRAWPPSPERGGLRDHPVPGSQNNHAATSLHNPNRPALSGLGAGPRIRHRIGALSRPRPASSQHELATQLRDPDLTREAAPLGRSPVLQAHQPAGHAFLAVRRKFTGLSRSTRTRHDTTRQREVTTATQHGEPRKRAPHSRRTWRSRRADAPPGPCARWLTWTHEPGGHSSTACGRQPVSDSLSSLGFLSLFPASSLNICMHLYLLLI